MLSFNFDSVKRVLCLGAHSDDIEIGCGGTLLKLAQERPDIEVTWVVFSGEGKREQEARNSAKAFLKGFKKSKIITKPFRTSFFPYEGERIKRFFETLKKVEPDIVFTHQRHDRHQDHRVLSDLAWNTWRNHLLLEYEIPKYDGDLGAPNVFIPIEQQFCDKKVQYLCRFFQTQGNKHWFAAETFFGLMRLRGMESASTHAEAFYARKLLLS
jgi:LmbE family N-acetylglucosaminyl deacetylase